MASDDYAPGAVLHLVKSITHHRPPGSGVLITTELTKLTHVTVRVLGKTVGRNPTPDEIEAMSATPPPVTVDDAMVERLRELAAVWVAKFNRPSGSWKGDYQDCADDLVDLLDALNPQQVPAVDVPGTGVGK